MVIVSLLAPALAAPGRAAVNGGSVVTDRANYVGGMPVTATATFDYSGSPSDVEDAAFVEWRDAGGGLAAPGRWVGSTAKGGGTVQFLDTWGASGIGVGFTVTFTTNRSTSDTTPVTATAAFAVHDPGTYAIVTGIAVRTDRRYYENNTGATATASMTDLPGWIVGDPASVGSVNFTWLDPGLAVVRTSVVPAAGGLAVDSWLTSAPGNGYRVLVTYLGDDPVTNSTAFDVTGPTIPARDVAPGAFAFWPADPRPWKVCGNLTVGDGGMLMIEAGATVVFCRGATLVVYGSLRIAGTSLAPVRFAAADRNAGPGEWGGIRIEAESGTTSIVRGLVLEGATDGLTALGASPSVYDARFVNGTGAAVRLVDSHAVLVDVSVSAFGWGLHASGSDPYVLRFAADACMEGVELLDSAGTFEDLAVTGALDNGMNLTRSTPALNRPRVEGSGDIAMSTEATTATLRDATLLGGLTTLRARNTIVTFESSRLEGASARGLDLVNATLTFRNSTVASSGLDLLLIASTVRFVNGTFDETSRLSVSSNLYVENFLHIRAQDEAAAPVPGANVTLYGGLEAWTQRTGPDGMLRWQEVADHRFLPNGLRLDYAPILNVTKMGYDTLDPDRVLDMSAGRSETFNLRRVIAPVIIPPKASFTAVVSDLAVQFTDTSAPSSGAVLQDWTWLFGDGGTSPSRSPGHAYPTAGTYVVQLTVVDSAGRSDSAFANLTFTAPVNATDRDEDGMPNVWEVAYGLDPGNPADAAVDRDGDNATNLQEYLAESNPNDPASRPGGSNGNPTGNSTAPVDPLPALLVSTGAAAAVVGVGALLAVGWGRRRRARAIEHLDLRDGTAYLLQGPSPAPAYALLRHALAKRSGLVIGRAPPADLRRRHALKASVPVYSLTRTAGEGHLMPTNLGAILDAVAKHLAANPGGAALLDGLEYLLMENEFPKMVRLLQKLAETAAVHRGVVLIPFDLNSVTPQRDAQLTKALEVV